ncbi:MAG TPA: hypothetical protein VJ124_10745 [Pyrinomonadaceae bacterium]|nr:hypothetical protein [Pyrinomonadaceae bacterium]
MHNTTRAAARLTRRLAVTRLTKPAPASAVAKILLALTALTLTLLLGEVAVRIAAGTMDRYPLFYK